MKQKRSRLFLIHGLLCLLFVLLLFFNGLSAADSRLKDRLYREYESPLMDIVLITIDEESLEALGRWPWPRQVHGDLLEILAEADAAVIGYDVVFAEPSLDPEEDERLVEGALLAERLVLPVVGFFDDSAAPGMLEAEHLLRSLPELEAASVAGHINTLPEPDGMLRRTLLRFSHEDEILQSFAYETYAAYQEYLGEPALPLEAIPRDAWERTYIRFAAEPFSMEQIPFHLVLDGSIPGEYFRGKIVMVGPFTAGIVDDYYFTPTTPEVPMYGVEVHANIVQQLIQERFLRDAPLAAEILLLLMITLLGVLLFYRFTPSVAAAVWLGIAGIYATGAWMMSRQGLALTLLLPVGLSTSQYVMAVGHRFVEEQIDKQRVTSIFGKYVAPQVVEKVLSEGEEALKLGGSRRDVTVLFVDIRGFTPLSEAASPEEVVAILNEYLTLCAESIYAFEGTLDKFIGDATMALFNAPLDQPDHPFKAVQAAWAMAQGAVPLEKRLQEQYGRKVTFGVGVHTGPAVVGNTGATLRMDYTAIGDTVNTAARIESNSKPGQILISRDVYLLVKERVTVKDLGKIQVKGKAEGIHVYEVTGIDL